jgi:hydroxymethylbilane synthase
VTLNFATRPSALARWQTDWVIDTLQGRRPGLQCRQVVITTQGDRILERPLPEIGGKGVFTQELEAELLSGRVQAAVHSLKDLPVENVPGLMIGAIPPRADARDVLISQEGYQLDTLPRAGRVGTSSLRRSAQLLAYRPDLDIVPLRGNIDTRIRKQREGEYAAIILAAAGVLRLGMENVIVQWLPWEVMLPAPGQGALAVQCRIEDGGTRQLLSMIDDPSTRQATTAERSFLEGLGGGCSLPVAAYATVRDGTVNLHGLVASADGRKIVRVEGTDEHPKRLGQTLAQQALAQGGAEILATMSPAFDRNT